MKQKNFWPIASLIIGLIIGQIVFQVILATDDDNCIPIEELTNGQCLE